MANFVHSPIPHLPTPPISAMIKPHRGAISFLQRSKTCLPFLTLQEASEAAQHTKTKIPMCLSFRGSYGPHRSLKKHITSTCPSKGTQIPSHMAFNKISCGDGTPKGHQEKIRRNPHAVTNGIRHHAGPQRRKNSCSSPEYEMMGREVFLPNSLRIRLACLLRA